MSRRCAAATILLPALVAHGAIELRGGVEVSAPIEAVTLTGVRVGGSAPRTIAWDRIKVITGEFASDALEYEEIADAAWRARTRLARGDAMMAEPLFAWLFNLYQLEDGPTAELVTTGYLRCLLDRGAQADAVAPWLDTIRLGAVVADPDASNGSEPGPLQPRLAPIFEDSPELRALAESGLPSKLQATGGQAHALAWWYAEAARFDAGLPKQLVTTRPNEQGADEDDLEFIERLVLCRTGDRAERKRARAQLERVYESDTGTWREAWARTAVGRSLLLEDDEHEQHLGIIELLHVPARYADDQPALAALALRDAARAMRNLGDHQAADALLEQLRSIDPSRPAPPPRPPTTHIAAEAIHDATDAPTDTRNTNPQ